MVENIDNTGYYLSVAAEEGDLIMIEELRPKANIFHIRLALLSATRANQVAVLDKFHSWNVCPDTFGYLMGGAALLGHRDIIEWLAAHGYKDGINEALRTATKMRRPEIVSRLLELGAPNVNDIMQVAAHEGYPELMRLAKAHGASQHHSTMFEAATNAKLDAMKLAHDWLVETAEIPDYGTLLFAVKARANTYGEQYHPMVDQVVRWIRNRDAKSQHTEILNMAIALHSLRLPPYVMLELVDWAVSGPLTETAKVALIVGVLGK